MTSSSIKKLKRRRLIARFLLLVTVFQIFQVPAFALTSGPTQPEVQSFEPAGTTDMVDLFSGDFTYNIPLFELPGPNGGYPFNLSYHAGIGMDQEASWVGLGWNLNPGSINRQMRGLPDEFKGDLVHTKMSIAPSVTVGVGAGTGVEVFGSDALSLNMGLSVYNNNYKGVGYSIDASLGFGNATQTGMTAGLGISLDSQAGVSISPSIGLGSETGILGLGAGYNSKSGLSSVSVDYTGNTKAPKVDNINKRNVASGVSASLSLAHPGYTPQVSMPMRNANLAVTFKAGGSWWAAFGSPYLSGFYNEQWLDDDGKRVPSAAYGYLNYQHTTGGSSILDFNREKDGMVSSITPNLGIPSLTYDIYSATGQGISAMYRPIRNDVGVVNDPVAKSKTVGASAGVDVAPALVHVGFNLTVKHAQSTSGPWSGENERFIQKFKFEAKEVNSLYEPWYFKVHGEPNTEPVENLNDIGGLDPVTIKLSDNNNREKPTAEPVLLRKGKPDLDLSTKNLNKERKSRSQVIFPITNEELLKGEEEVLDLFKIRFIDHNDSLRDFKRTPANYPVHHMAGYTALTPDGLRYVYGLPAYNKHQEDVVFSVKPDTAKDIRVDVTTDVPQVDQVDPDFRHEGTDKYLKKTELPPYAHSFLLTSIVGPDYIDITGNGVTEDDLGYWVKFTYKKITSGKEPFKWRDPYVKAHYQEGFKSDDKDDKGSYVYGEKEIWYLAKAETKSHEAVFVTDERFDGKGVVHRLQGTIQRGKSLHKLKEIQLYTRSAGPKHPIKKVKFQYDYSLCQGIPNNVSPYNAGVKADTWNINQENKGNGKLTLKKLYFEYGGSSRGSLNPYIFTYNSNNPDYNYLTLDRWGNYKPVVGDPLANIDFPYTSQNVQNKNELDKNAAAWSLHKIQLPSGGTVAVDFEIDDYAYVQHKQAMQMTEIVDAYATPTGTIPTNIELEDDALKIRFKLKHFFDGSISIDQQKNEIVKYLNLPDNQLYFKALMYIKKEDRYKEYIQGYCDIDFNKAYGLEKDNTGKFVYGYFHIKPEQKRHPFSMRSWQHLRVNQPDLANIGNPILAGKDNDLAKKINQINSVASLGPQIRRMFLGFYGHCSNEGWGRKLQAGKSWVRLSSPDKIKYGGGLRVKQITMSDQWSHDQEGYYGQVYEYTKKDENEAVISSGVAAYEPFVGGDENPLRVAKKYVETVPLRSDNNLFFEYPINESQYPGAQVGYSQVTVKTLAAAALEASARKTNRQFTNIPSNLFPTGEGKSFGTTGVTVHEFYTARDFPVITEETEKNNVPFKVSVSIPFLGHLTINNMTATQGYTVITNDMHGKPKKVSNYRQEKSGLFEEHPMSWVRYNYRSDGKVYDKENVFALNNILIEDEHDKNLIGTNPNNANKKYFLGQESEFFIDMREYEDEAWDGGVRINTDVIMIPFFPPFPLAIPTVWPSIGKSTSRLRTAVTNKIIFQSGILESVEAYDGGSLVKTENLKWDKLTGTPVLTSVNNNYDAPIFSYSIPAFRQYKGMGAAYQNIGFQFYIKTLTKAPFRNDLYHFSMEGVMGDHLNPGDECIIYNKVGDDLKPVTKAIYIGKEAGNMLLQSDFGLTGNSYVGMIIRSGFRNQLSAGAGNITALEDPSKNSGTTNTYSKTISVIAE